MFADMMRPLHGEKEPATDLRTVSAAIPHVCYAVLPHVLVILPHNMSEDHMPMLDVASMGDPYLVPYGMPHVVALHGERACHRLTNCECSYTACYAVLPHGL